MRNLIYKSVLKNIFLFNIILFSTLFCQQKITHEYSIINHLYIGVNFQLGYQFNQGAFISNHYTLGLIDLFGLVMNNIKNDNWTGLPEPGLCNPGITFGGKRAWGGYRSIYYEFQNSFVFGGIGVGKEFIYNKSNKFIYTKTRRKIWLIGFQFDYQKDNNENIKSHQYSPDFVSISLLGSLPLSLIGLRLDH